MAKAVSTKAVVRRKSVSRGRRHTSKFKIAYVTTATNFFAESARLKATRRAAGYLDLIDNGSAPVGMRIRAALLEAAKKRTGIATDTDVIEFALANVALEDNFGEVLEKVRGTVDPSLKLDY